MEQPLDTVAVPDYLSIWQNLDIEEGELTYFREPKNSPQGNETDKNIEDAVKQVQQCPISEETPKPIQEEPARQQHSSWEIIGDLDSTNIIDGPRERRPSRKQAYYAELAKLDETPGFYAAFIVSTYTRIECLH